jgi:hypothetical protein
MSLRGCGSIYEGCDITSQSIACDGIRGGADPRLLHNRIYDGKLLASM